MKRFLSWLLRRPPDPTTQRSRPLDTAFDNYNENDDVTYETRAVAFIDILGWSRAVEDSATSPELRRKLLNAVWALSTQSKKDVEDDTPENPSFDQATQFSDNVVISIPYSGHRDLMRLIGQITSYQHSMFTLGLPLRGGIAVGPLFHAGSLVFGPALNEAYSLESKMASHPRVVVAKSLNPQIEKAARSLPRHWSFVVKDDDGFYSTDFLMIFAKSEWAWKHIDRKFEHWLMIHHGDERIFPKYAWLKTRWEAAKADAGWRSEKSREIRESFIRSKQLRSRVRSCFWRLLTKLWGCSGRCQGGSDSGILK